MRPFESLPLFANLAEIHDSLVRSLATQTEATGKVPWCHELCHSLQASSATLVWMHVWKFDCNQVLSKRQLGLQGLAETNHCYRATGAQSLVKGSKGDRRITCHACVERYIFRWGGEGERIQFVFLLPIILAHHCLFAGSILSQRQAAFLLGCCTWIPEKSWLLGSISNYESASFLNSFLLS